MWSLEAIEYVNQEAANNARRQRKEPYVPSLNEIENCPPFPLPHLASYIPTGWERIEGKEWFVDSFGWGKSGDPALTAQEFRDELHAYIEEHPDHGFAIVEAGLFQCFVGAYERRAA